MRDDLKAAFRSLTSSWTFTAVALTILALGIGAGTAIFSVVDAVVLRGLPFDEHDRLVAVGARRVPGPNPEASRDPQAVSSIAPQNYLDWSARQQVFESMAAIAGGAVTLRESGAEPEALTAQRVTASFFNVLRTAPAIGRTFGAENEVDGAHRIAVLSDGLWRRRFGGDPSIVGRTIPLEGGAYEIAGVMPPGFEYPVGAARPTELWVPYVVPANERTRNPSFRSIYLSSVARLKPGVSLEQAQANMDQIAAALQAEHPEWNKDSLAGVRRLADHTVGANTRSWMLMLLGAVGIVLLIACANVANLLLARATGREREVGIRSALGAGRGRIVRQLLVESLVLSVIGTAIALVLAWWGVQVLRTALPEGVPRVTTIAIDVRVLAVAAIISLATGLLFGLFPALQLSKTDLSTALKDGSRGASSGGARGWARSLLVVTEVALSVVLLVGAALFIGSFISLMRIDPGFSPENVLTTSVAPRVQPGARAGGPVDNGAAFEQIVERLREAPGVLHASAISGGMPLGGSMSMTTMTLREQKDWNDSSVSIRRVTPDYHRALRIPLRGGRLFETTDRKGGAPVVILNEAAAKKYFPGVDAVGKTVVLDGADKTVVGVVGNIYQTSLEAEPAVEAYTPMAQGPATFAELVIHTSGDPYLVLPAVKSAVLAALPDVPLRNVRTMEEVIARRVAQRRLNMLLLGLFGVLGLVISAVGIYGVMAYTVSQRTREIGVRMALGASRGNVISMVMVKAAMLVGVGLVLGTGAAWALSGTASRFLFRLEHHDLRAFAVAVVTLAVAALIASAIPARRAASVDPMIALRAE